MPDVVFTSSALLNKFLALAQGNPGPDINDAGLSGLVERTEQLQARGPSFGDLPTANLN